MWNDLEVGRLPDKKKFQTERKSFFRIAQEPAASLNTNTRPSSGNRKFCPQR